MKKLIVIAIVGMMVMGLSLAANAGSADGVWAVYMQGADQSGANYLAVNSIFGSSGTVESDTNAGAGVSAAQVALTSFDSGVGTASNGMTKIMRPVGTANNVYNLKLWGLDQCAATGFKLTAWNPTGTYDLAAGSQAHLKVISVPAGVTLTDNSTGTSVTVPDPTGYSFTFASSANGTQAAPQLNWMFNFSSMPKSGAPIVLQLVPEPGSMLAMLSGLVGLVGYGIRRRK